MSGRQARAARERKVAMWLLLYAHLCEYIDPTSEEVQRVRVMLGADVRRALPPHWRSLR